MKLHPAREVEYLRLRMEATSRGRRLYEYAERWASCMESRVLRGESVAAVADQESHRADDGSISGFAFGCAAKVLADFWLYGEDLRRWMNIRACGPEQGARANAIPGAVANPAIIKAKCP